MSSLGDLGLGKTLNDNSVGPASDGSALFGDDMTTISTASKDPNIQAQWRQVQAEVEHHAWIRNMSMSKKKALKKALSNTKIEVEPRKPGGLKEKMLLRRARSNED